jgi:xylosylprotein 4-beta-galactosyltransferase
LFCHQERYIGGILVVPNGIFEKVGGMNNFYWGWDHEDNEFHCQLDRFNITINRHSKHIGTSYDDTVLHLHDIKARPRDFTRCQNQTTNSTALRDPKAGLKFTNYNLLDVQELTIEENEVTFLNVQLICDRQITPWCDC